MNPSMSDDLLAQLRSDGLPRMAEQLGVAPQQAEQAVAAALPLLFGAMGRNARQPQGAEALLGALGRDHRGLDAGNVLGTVLAGGGAGGGILRHVFGARQPMATQALGGIGGLGNDRAGMLMKMLAPVVLAYLARRMFAPAERAVEPTPQALGGLLENETEQARTGPAGGLLSMLDRDGDGDVDFADLTAAAGGFSGQTAEMRSPRPSL